MSHKPAVIGFSWARIGISEHSQVVLQGLTKKNPSIFRGVIVAAVCDVCSKGPGFGHAISHSHRRTKRRFNPNIQTVHAVVNNSPKRLNVCTSCIKAGKVSRV